MSCPGLHCPGCSQGQSIGVLGGVALGLVLLDAGVPWVAERIWWIGGTVTVCIALAVATGMWLERWSDRRGARFAAAHGILSRADVMLAEVIGEIRLRQTGGIGTGVPDYEIREPITDSRRAAIAPPQVVFNFYGPLDAGQAAIIRQALPGIATDGITKEG